MINTLMYNNNVRCPVSLESASIHTEYTKRTRKQVLALYFHHTYRTRRKEGLSLLPTFLTISHITCLLKTENCYALNMFYSNIKITTIIPTMKSNTYTFKSLPQIQYHHINKNNIIRCNLQNPRN